MKIEIKNRWSGEIIFSTEAVSMRVAVESAIEAKANLSEANLSGANLSKANLSEADLSGANLSWSKLCDACLHLALITYRGETMRIKFEKAKK